MTKIISCGSNRLNQLWIPENTKMGNSKYGYNIVNTPTAFTFDEDILSISTYRLHSIYVDKKGKAHQIGSTDPAKCFNIEDKKVVKEEKDEIELSFEENDVKKQYQALSAVCGYCYSLFLVQEKVDEIVENPNNYIFYYYKTQEEAKAQFIDTRDINPFSIYGGWRISAAIEKNDKILIFTPNKEPMQIVSFPPNYLEEDEFPTSIACLEDSVIVLTGKKKAIEYKLNQNDDEKAFKKIDINNIRNISGTYKHCFLVTEDFHVYGKGNNSCGQLGLGKVTNQNKNIEDFVLIKNLEDKKIVASYAGFNHSIFRSENGEIFVCGSNSHGQLFINHVKVDEDEDDEIATIPTKVEGIENVSFCIAGDCSSIAILDADIKNLNVPNKTYRGKLNRPNK